MKCRLFVWIGLLTMGCWMADAQTATTFRIPGAMGQLEGEVRLPAVEPGETVPLVILCHGFTGDRTGATIQAVADAFADISVGTVCFDFNGHGKSEGSFSDMTVLNEIDDLMAVISYARGLPQVGDISLLGHSQGGVVAAMTAGRLGKNVIAGLMLMAPAAVLRDDALRGNTMGATYDPWHCPGTVTLPTGHKLGRAYIQTAMQLPVYETASRYEGPVLVIHGMADRIVPYTYGERFAECMPDCSVTLIPGEDHVFSVQLPYAASLVAAWFRKTFIPEP